MWAADAEQIAGMGAVLDGSDARFELGA